MVGLVRGVHGLRGGLRVEILTDNPDRFAPGSVLHPEGEQRELTVVSAQRDGPGLLVRFAEVNDRNAADRLRDTYLEAAAEAAALPEDSFYWHEIIGCAVSTNDGDDLGTVADVFRIGESEVFIVRGKAGETLVPAVRAVVVELAPKQGRIVIDAGVLGLRGDGDETDEPDRPDEAEAPEAHAP